MNKVGIELVVEVDFKNLNEFKLDDIKKHENMNMDETEDVSMLKMWEIFLKYKIT